MKPEYLFSSRRKHRALWFFEISTRDCYHILRNADPGGAPWCTHHTIDHHLRERGEASSYAHQFLGYMDYILNIILYTVSAGFGHDKTGVLTRQSVYILESNLDPNPLMDSVLSKLQPSMELL